jgi:divalent metal cation (Fe/Co/Zn/Cd) transporter
VATIIAYNGIKLFLENFSFLLGRSPGPEYLSRIESQALSVPGVLGIHDLRAEYVGPDTVHAGMHIEVQSGLTIDEANQIAEEVDRRIHQGSHSGYCFIHVDAAKPQLSMPPPAPEAVQVN